MTNEMKLLRAFIEASGFDIKDVITGSVEDEISVHDGLSIINSCDNSGMVVVNGEYKRGDNNSYFYRVVDAVYDYKVTKKVEHYKHHGDYFSLGCAVLSEDLQKALHKEGVDCGDNDIRNVCKAIIDTVVFHIKKD